MLSSEEASRRVQRWVNESKTLRIFVFGKLGAGKSTLINSLLNKQVAEVGSGLVAVTTEVSDYSDKIEEVHYKKIKIYDIDVTLWDTPGLQDPLVDKDRLLEDIRSNISDNVDLYVYCIQMTQVRAEQGDYDAIIDLTRSLGTDFWKRSLFALTFANDVSVPLSADGKTLQEYFDQRVDGWTKILRTAVLKAGVNRTDVDHIPVIPTGIRKERIPALVAKGTPWFSTFWITCLNRIRFFSIPAFLTVNQEEWSTEVGDAITVRVITERLQRMGDQLELQIEQDPHSLLEIPKEDLWGYLKDAILNKSYTDTDSAPGQHHNYSRCAQIVLVTAAAAVIAGVVYYYWRKE